MDILKADFCFVWKFDKSMNKQNFPSCIPKFTSHNFNEAPFLMLNNLPKSKMGRGKTEIGWGFYWSNTSNFQKHTNIDKVNRRGKMMLSLFREIIPSSWINYVCYVVDADL